MLAPNKTINIIISDEFLFFPFIAFGYSISVWQGLLLRRYKMPLHE